MSTVQLARIIVDYSESIDQLQYDLLADKRIEWAKSNAINITISRTTNALTFEQYMIATAKLTPIQQTEYLLRFT